MQSIQCGCYSGFPSDENAVTPFNHKLHSMFKKNTRWGPLNTCDITTPMSQPFYHVANMTMEEICIAMTTKKNEIRCTLYEADDQG